MDERDRTAYHEAGHIIVAWALGQLPLYGVVRTKEQLDALMWTEDGQLRNLASGFALAAYYDDENEKPPLHSLVCLGGYAAEQHLGVANPWIFFAASPDHKQAVEYASAHFSSHDETVAFIRGFAMKSTKQIVDGHWPLVEALAEELKVKKRIASIELDYFLRSTHIAQLEQLNFAPVEDGFTDKELAEIDEKNALES